MCYNINSIKVCTTFSLSFVALKQILGEQFLVQTLFSFTLIALLPIHSALNFTHRMLAGYTGSVLN